MIPENKNFKAVVRDTFYRDGQLFIRWTVYVPNPTISGGYRHEHVVTVAQAHEDE